MTALQIATNNIEKNLKRLMTCYQDGSRAENHLEDALCFACAVLKQNGNVEALETIASILEVPND